MLQKPSTDRDKEYLAWIRRLPCLCCLNATGTPTEAHHVNLKGRGGKGIKTSDYRTIPLCTDHHREHDAVGKWTFAQMHGICYEIIIWMLNRIYEEWKARNESNLSSAS